MNTTIQEGLNTRSHILHIASDLFAKRGYNGTSIRDISESTGVTKPVLYYYFRNKEHLYVTIIDEAYSSFLGALSEAIENGNNFRERLAGITRIYIQACSGDDSVLRLIFGALFGPKEGLPPLPIWEHEKKHIQILNRLFQEAMDQGVIRSRPVEAVMYHFLGAINIYLLARLAAHESFPSDLEETILDLVFHGIE